MKKAILIALFFVLSPLTFVDFANAESCDSKEAANLIMKICLSKDTFLDGEAIDATVSLTNTGESDIRIFHNVKHVFDLIVYDSQGNKVYSWSEAHLTNLILGPSVVPPMGAPTVPKVLKPGETISEILVWPQKGWDSKAFKYTELAPGNYILQGALMGGSPGVNLKDLRPSLSVTISDEVFQGSNWFSTSLHSDKARYNSGEDIALTFSVKNHNRNSDFVITGSCMVNFLVYNAENEIIYDQLKEGCITNQRSLDLAPNQEKSFSATFGTKNLNKGTYTIRGLVASIASNDLAVTLDKSSPAAKDDLPLGLSSWVRVSSSKSSYASGETVTIRAEVKPVSDVPVKISIIGPGEKTYLMDEFVPNDEGMVQLTFDIKDTHPVGTWNVIASYMDSERKTSFKVVETGDGESVPASPEVQKLKGTAAIKNQKSPVKKLTLISIKNTGFDDISSLLMKFDEGSIRSVKAKYWDRERISDDMVLLSPSKIMKKKSPAAGLEPGDQMTVLLWWKERPNIPGNIKLDIITLQDYLNELHEKIKQLENELKSVGDDQLANADLKNKLQKEQHTLQLISSVSKIMHNTAVIRMIE